MHWELLLSVQSQNAKAHLGANLLRIWDDGCFYASEAILFPIASALVLPTHDQFDTFRCPLMSSAKDGLLRWVDCDTCLLTLKAFAGPCMVYANSFNRCFHLIWRCYCWWCRSYRIISYRRIPFYQVAMTGQLEHHEHDPSDNSGTKPEQPGVS